MQTAKLKTYAPRARRDFIAAVTHRAAKFGLTAKGASQVREEGQLVFIEGQPYPRSVGAQRAKLAARIQQQGFQQVMEAAAYTWFNRFAAIRFMELHGYLDHSFRVLSPSPLAGEGQGEGASSTGLPEILEQAQHVDLPGLDRQRVIDLKMDGTRDEELYRDLLLAQCRALHQAMPFLFERVDDETELLLPEHLLQTDSLIRELVTAIPEEDWQEIEIIGWLYQFYISEKKDQVIGKVVKSEDIPAATQLFTPNWIVKYMVQNSLGAQWLATYPDSPLKGQMAYYIEPAEQTEEVKAQLAAITPDNLNPEELTLMDPACGSGHILVEAYELFKAIYLERGYRQRDVARLILEKNLFGLDIDGRAAQLGGFALMMKARADDRRLFERGVKLNVMAFVDSAEFDAERLTQGATLADYGLRPSDLTQLKRLFEHATTFGSLIQMPGGLAAKLPALKKFDEVTNQDLFVADALNRLGPLAQQAELLAARYDVVVANPPYMGTKYHSPALKAFVKDYYSGAKPDLFACFIERGYTMAKKAGHNAMVTMQSWMFLSSFEKMRERMLREKTISTMVHIGYNSFPALNSKIAQATVHSLRNDRVPGYISTFFDLNSAPPSADKRAVFLERDPAKLFHVLSDEFSKIPGSPIAYSASDNVRLAFANPSLEQITVSEGQNITADNDKYVKFCWEVDSQDVGRNRKWLTYAKGGDYRKWFGNLEYVVDWSQIARDHYRKSSSSRIIPEYLWYEPGITWTLITWEQSFRYLPVEATFDKTGSSVFFKDSTSINSVLGFLNSKVSKCFTALMNPTLALQVKNVRDLPVAFIPSQTSVDIVMRCLGLSKSDYYSSESSIQFCAFPLLCEQLQSAKTIKSSYTAWTTQNRDTIAEMKRLEEENNRLFIDAYGLQDELTPEVPIEQITLTVNPAYRYGGKLTEEEQWTRFRQDTMQELVSYAVGCAMGRYSLDEPGLIYSHSGNVGFDPSRYATFPADADGIIPITDTDTDTDWFDDDAAHQVVEFIAVAWDKGHLEENLRFLADNLSPKRDESSRETIRRYLCDSFFKDHLQTYKNRPIYWCFSSGKQKAFQCLVYLHRYHSGTLARIRMEYVVPLQGKMAARIESLANDIQAASSSAQAKRLQKERDKLAKQLEELRRYDEQLRHYADQRIALDLDDGVKVNYAKFGNLLAGVKTVTGTNPD